MMTTRGPWSISHRDARGLARPPGTTGDAPPPPTTTPAHAPQSCTLQTPQTPPPSPCPHAAVLGVSADSRWSDTGAGDNIRSLWTVRYEDFSLRALLTFAGAYFLSAAWTSGLALPSGSFSSTILLGSCVGRIFAHVVRHTGVIPDPDAPLFSLLGAAGLFTGAPHAAPRRACCRWVTPYMLAFTVVITSSRHHVVM